MSDAEKVKAIQAFLSDIFDTKTENTETDKAYRNIAREIQIIVEDDYENSFEQN